MPNKIKDCNLQQKIQFEDNIPDDIFISEGMQIKIFKDDEIEKKSKYHNYIIYAKDIKSTELFFANLTLEAALLSKTDISELLPESIRYNYKQLYVKAKKNNFRR
jgi:hypothetical protein